MDHGERAAELFRWVGVPPGAIADGLVAVVADGWLPGRLEEGPTPQDVDRLVLALDDPAPLVRHVATIALAMQAPGRLWSRRSASCSARSRAWSTSSIPPSRRNISRSRPPRTTLRTWDTTSPWRSRCCAAARRTSSSGGCWSSGASTPGSTSWPSLCSRSRSRRRIGSWRPSAERGAAADPHGPGPGGGHLEVLRGVRRGPGLAWAAARPSRMSRFLGRRIDP